ncbi:MAG TPA: amidohydrolase family protein [Bryobacteraceae bacterium]|nr:amidohydrolase family protein [Bryobacteraceae bacterium]
MVDAIDAHVHVWTDDRVRYPRAPGSKDYEPARFTPEDLFVHTKPAGVKRIVLIQMSFYRFDNSYMTDAIRSHPGVFSGVGIVDESAVAPDRAMEELAKLGVRGFRIVPGASADAWLETTGMQAMWSMAAKRKLAMCPLIGPNALPAIDRMCTKHPDTPVVIDHLARIGADGSVRDSDVRLLCGLAKHKNVKVKVSAFYALGRKQAPYKDLAPLIRRVFEDYGPRRLMWASDCPFQVENGHRYAPSIALIRDGLPFLSQEDRDWILARTAASVFFDR